MKMLDELINPYLTIKLSVRKHKIGVYFPSELPFCLRKQYFRYVIPKDLLPAQRRVFGAGWVWHEFLYDVLRSAGRKIKVLSIEKRYTLTYSSKIVVLDCVVDAEIEVAKQKIVVEIKSVKSLTKRMNEPMREHVLQVTPYLSVAKTKKAILIYVDKQTLQTKEFPVEFVQANLDLMFERAILLHKALLKKRVPARVGAGQDWQCTACEYKIECDTYELFEFSQKT